MSDRLVKARLRHRLLRAYWHSPDHPMKLRIYDWCRNLNYFRRANIAFDYGRFSLDIVDFVQNEMFLYGCYEPETLALFETLVETGGVVVDVGANVGQYAIAAARLAGGDGRVAAVEPNPQVCARLIDNIRLNDFESRITIVTAPMSDRAQLLAFGLPDERALGTTRLRRADEPGGFVALSSTIVDLIAHLDMGRIDVLKIDVEGHDVKVIDGALTNPGVRPSHILFEYIHQSFDYGVGADAIGGHFAALGYSLFTIDGAPYSPGREIPEGNLWARRL